MGILLELLTSENFRKRPGMYCGRNSFGVVGPWLRGLAYGIRQAFPDQPDDLEGFREWLHMTLDAPGNVDWTGIIAWKFGEQDAGTQKLFEQFDLFRNDTAQRGVEAVIHAHREYEIRRYGSPVSSRLGGIGQQARQP